MLLIAVFNFKPVNSRKKFNSYNKFPRLMVDFDGQYCRPSSAESGRSMDCFNSAIICCHLFSYDLFNQELYLVNNIEIDVVKDFFKGHKGSSVSTINAGYYKAGRLAALPLQWRGDDDRYLTYLIFVAVRPRTKT